MLYIETGSDESCVEKQSCLHISSLILRKSVNKKKVSYSQVVLQTNKHIESISYLKVVYIHCDTFPMLLRRQRCVITFESPDCCIESSQNHHSLLIG